MMLAALLCAIGNVVFAVTPAFAGLVVGRAITGFGLGMAIVAGPVFARATTAASNASRCSAPRFGSGSPARLGVERDPWRSRCRLAAHVPALSRRRRDAASRC